MNWIMDRSGLCDTRAAIFTYHLNMNSGDIMSQTLQFTPTVKDVQKYQF